MDCSSKDYLVDMKLYCGLQICDYTFNLNKIRVPSKYPGKRNYSPGKIMENHLAISWKNPSTIGNYD